MFLKFLLKLLIIFAFVANSYGQLYNFGTSPGSVKWNQIKHGKFNLVFPVESKETAQRFANILSLTESHLASGINSNIRKPIKILLHNQSVNSNGFVTLVPRRMELIATPPQESYAQPWLDLLAIHEFRHVAQIDKLNQGFTRGISLFSGELGIGATTSLIPTWFYEGDAVFAETILSKTGRGREPYFQNGLKAIELEKDKRLRYDQVYLGTYRTYAPNHYEFGYQMVAYANYKFGPDIWSNAIDKVARQAFTFSGFYRSLKKDANLSKVKLYNETFDFLNAHWEQEAKNRVISTHKLVETHFESNFVSYTHAHERSDGSIIALRRTIDDIDKLVEIKNGKEKRIAVLGRFRGEQIAQTESYIAWEEIRNNVRWEQKSYSIIKIHNLDSNKTSILKLAERHFSPSINPGQNRIAVQKVYPTNQSKVEIYDIETKYLVKDFEHPEKDFLSYNTWINDSLIAIVATADKGKAIYLLNTSTAKWNKIIGYTYYNITHLYSDGKRLYFTFTLDGSQAIYCYDFNSSESFKVVGESIGADYASTFSSGDSLVYSAYTSEGYKLRKAVVKESLFTHTKLIQPYSYKLADANLIHATFNSQDSISVTETKFKVEKYSKLKHAINIHSWLVPFYFDADNISTDLGQAQSLINPGITVMSQNLLSTLDLTLGYYLDKGRQYLRPSVTYRGWYPILSADLKLGNKPKIYNVNAPAVPLPTQLENELQLNARVSMPLSLSNSRWSSRITPALRVVHENAYFADTIIRPGVKEELFDNGVYYIRGRRYSDLTLSAYFQSKLSYKELYPNWGANFYFSFQNQITNQEYFRNDLTLLGRIYLPGLARSHSTFFVLGYEDGPYFRLPIPGIVSEGRLPSVSGANLFSANYFLPLFNPDLSVGPIAYIKRVHLTVNYSQIDFTPRQAGSVNIYENPIKTSGVELGFETNFLRFVSGFTPTIGYTYLLNTGDSQFNFFVNASLSF